MKWFFAGGAAVLAFAVVGLVIRKRQQRKSSAYQWQRSKELLHHNMAKPGNNSVQNSEFIWSGSGQPVSFIYQNASVTLKPTKVTLASGDTIHFHGVSDENSEERSYVLDEIDGAVTMLERSYRPKEWLRILIGDDNFRKLM